VCLLLCVLVCGCALQCQEQRAHGENEKDGEDFAGEGEKVVHVRKTSLRVSAETFPAVRNS
jgi:hypothetical protein